jgi:hypothetical protein
VYILCSRDCVAGRTRVRGPEKLAGDKVQPSLPDIV